MSIAETAQLAVDLKLKNELHSGAQQAQGDLQRLNTAAAKTEAATGRVTTGFGKASTAARGFGAGLSHAKGAIGGLLSGPLGMIGLGVGIAGVTKFFSDSVGKAEEFGRTSTQLARIIGMDVGKTSQLVDVLDKFGISGDKQISMFARLEKNVATYAAAQDKATAAVDKSEKVLHSSTATAKERAKATADLAKAQGVFGFSVKDSNGKIVDALELQARARDYFNSTATASQKATVLQKLYGKAWKDMIPIFQLTQQQYDKEFATALRLTPKQIEQTNQLREAQRELNDTWGDTQVLIGMALVPTFTRMATALNEFVGGHQKEIIGFFEGIAKFAEEAGSAIGTYVVPGVKAIADAWGAIPPDIKKLLIGGVVANKAIKMTFGFDVVDTLRKSLFNAVLGIKAGVVNVSGAVVNGGGVPGVGGGKPGLSPLGIGVSVLGGIGIAAAWKMLIQDPALDAQQRQVAANAKRQLDNNPSQHELLTGIRGIKAGIDQINATPGGAVLYAGQLEFLKKLLGIYETKIRETEITEGGKHLTPSQKNANANQNRGREVKPLTPNDLRTAAKVGTVEGNRDLPKRRDMDRMGLNIGLGVRALGAGIVNAERVGAANIVNAVFGVINAVHGIRLPAYLPQGSGPRRNNSASPSGPPGSNLPGYSPPTRHGGGRATGGRVWGGAEFTVGESGPERLSMYEGGGGYVTPMGKRTGRSVHLNVNVSSSARSNEQAKTIQYRYGPIPSSAGSA